MRKPFLLASLLTVLIPSFALASGGILPGAGTEADPYLIEDVNDFDAFADPNNAATYWAAGVHTKLMTDIDLSGRTYTTAIIAPDTDNTTSGYQGVSYSGIFNGNGFLIINLKIDTAGLGNDYLGLFGTIEGTSTEVVNLGIKAMSIVGGNNSDNVGGLTSKNIAASITSCFVTGSITGGDDSDLLGGLCGSNAGYYIGNCYIKNCYAIVTVTGGENSYSLGGLCGRNAYSTITDCYSTGSVTAGANSELLGGFCGGSISTVLSDCFWNVESSDITIAYTIIIDDMGSTVYYPIYNDPESVEGKTTAEMQTQSTFTGWDFTTPDWMMLREGEDYPRLAWQEVFAGDIAGLYGVDLADFAEIARNWKDTGCLSNCEDADIDGSGDVGVEDLAAVANDWLK